MNQEFNDKLKELSFGENTKNFPNETDIELEDNLLAEEKESEDNNPDKTINKEDEEKNNEKKEEVNDEKIEVEIEDNDFEDEDVFKIFASELKEELFPELPDDKLNSIKSVDDIKTILRQEIDNTINTFKESYKQSVIDNLKKEGIIGTQQSSTSNPYLFEEEDIKDNDEKAKQVLITYYKEKGIEDEMINSIISSTIDLETDAIKALGSLKSLASEKIKQHEEQNAKQIENFTSELTTNIVKNKDYIPGYKVKETDTKKILDSIPELLNEINANLTEYAPKLAILKAAGILDGDFTKVILEGETKSTNKLKEVLLKARKTTGKPTNYGKPTIDIDHSDVNSWNRN